MESARYRRGALLAGSRENDDGDGNAAAQVVKVQHQEARGPFESESSSGRCSWTCARSQAVLHSGFQRPGGRAQGRITHIASGVGCRCREKASDLLFHSVAGAAQQNGEKAVQTDQSSAGLGCYRSPSPGALSLYPPQTWCSAPLVQGTLVANFEPAASLLQRRKGLQVRVSPAPALLQVLGGPRPKAHALRRLSPTGLPHTQLESLCDFLVRFAVLFRVPSFFSNFPSPSPLFCFFQRFLVKATRLHVTSLSAMCTTRHLPLSGRDMLWKRILPVSRHF